MQLPSWASAATIVANLGVKVKGKEQIIHITEENRATQYVKRRDAFEIITKILDEYRQKGVDGVIAGINSVRGVQFAVFLQPDYLTR